MMKTNLRPFWLGVLCLITLSGLFLVGESTTAVTLADFDCHIVTEIPVLECQALVALYNSIVDKPKGVAIDWFQSNTPCSSWQGVGCKSGHINFLDLRSPYIAPFGQTLPSTDLLSLSTWQVNPSSPTGGNTIPPEIGSLIYLETLYIPYLNLITLPPEFGNLSSLQELYLHDNKLISLPPEFGNLSSLQWFYLYGNELTSLPPEFGNLSSLKQLYLTGNELNSLPSEFGNLSSLERLYLYGNELTSLPPELGNLSSLEHLSLFHNQLTSLPPELGNLSSLKHLSLGNNQLTSLPPELGNLSNLGVLYLLNNQLTSLPPELGNLSSLRVLHLAHNQLSGTIPPELGNLSSLLQLHLDHNQLTSLPPELGNLSYLQDLYLHNNQLTSLPPELGNLSNLLWLYLDHNQLSGTIPSELESLTLLQYLRLDNNRLSGSLPLSFINLEDVVEFTFNNTDICEPTEGPVFDWLANIDFVQGTNVPCIATTQEVDSWVQSPPLASAGPGGNATIHLKYGNWGESPALSPTLTVTLDNNLTFLEAIPAPTTVMSQTIIWQVEDLAFWEQHDVSVFTAVPSAPIGTRYPVSLTISSQGNEALPLNNSTFLEVVISHQIFFPFIRD